MTSKVLLHDVRPTYHGSLTTPHGDESFIIVDIPHVQVIALVSELYNGHLSGESGVPGALSRDICVRCVSLHHP